MAKRLLKYESELPKLEKGFEEIKSLFKTGAIPKESDYASMIEYVHYLHRLLGVEGSDPAHTPQLGNGFIIENGVLSVLGFESAVPADAWINNMAVRLGATHIALSDKCTIFFAHSYTSETHITVATGFVKNANAFASQDGKPDGFILGGHNPYWPADGLEYEGFLSFGTFTLAYECELVEGLEYKLNMKSAPLALPVLIKLNVVAIG